MDDVFRALVRAFFSFLRWMSCWLGWMYQILFSPPKQKTLRVSGGWLYDRCGERVILRGVNKMAVYEEDPTCAQIFPQIRMTGANVVRIVWLMESCTMRLETGHGLI